jgi:hypothetical protein
LSSLRSELATRNSGELVALVRTPEERALQRARAHRVGSLLDLEARVLERRRIEQQCRQAVEIARVDAAQNASSTAGATGAASSGSGVSSHRSDLNMAPACREMSRWML